MIEPQQIFLAIDPVDMRLGIDGLSAWVQHHLECSPCQAQAFAFRNKRGNRIKVLFWDGTGVWLCHRRLHQGSFVWPKHSSERLELTAQQWQWLTQGVDWQRLSASAKMDWKF